MLTLYTGNSSYKVLSLINGDKTENLNVESGDTQVL